MSKSCEELKHLFRNFTIPETITPTDLRKFSADLVDHLRFECPDKLQGAFDQQAADDFAAKNPGAASWRSQSPEDADKIHAVAEEFVARIPQYVPCPANDAVILEYMEMRQLDIFSVDSWLTAFRRTAKFLELNPRAIGIDRPNVQGPQLLVLLDLYPRLLREPTAQETAARLEAERAAAEFGKLSAADYLAQQPVEFKMTAVERRRAAACMETFRASFPNWLPTEQNDQLLVIRTLELCKESGESFSPQMLARAYGELKSEGTSFDTYTEPPIYRGPGITGGDLGGSRPGYPTMDGLSRQSLINKLNRLSSLELNLFFRENPEVRKQLDAAG